MRRSLPFTSLLLSSLFGACVLPELAVDDSWSSAGTSNGGSASGSGGKTDGGEASSGGKNMTGAGSGNVPAGGEQNLAGEGAGGMAEAGGTPGMVGDSGASTGGSPEGGGGSPSPGEWPLCDPLYAPSASGCPASPPDLGSSCTTGTQCVYCETANACPAEPNYVGYTCSGGAWNQGGLSPNAVGCVCPQPPPLDGDNCNVGSRTCVYQSFSCICHAGNLAWDCN